MNALALILGGALAGAVVTVGVAIAILRLWPQLVPTAADSAPEAPPATAPFTASPVPLADGPSGRHASGAPAAPRHTPERAVERTHLMRPVGYARPVPQVNPTGIDSQLISEALRRGVTHPTR